MRIEGGGRGEERRAGDGEGMVAKEREEENKGGGEER